VHLYAPGQRVGTDRVAVSRAENTLSLFSAKAALFAESYESLG